tara:strand:- start:3324 stop:3482 length:159 start_codon:yes stop_codon:yes gene_type:complete
MSETDAKNCIFKALALLNLAPLCMTEIEGVEFYLRSALRHLGVNQDDIDDKA